MLPESVVAVIAVDVGFSVRQVQDPEPAEGHTDALSPIWIGLRQATARQESATLFQFYSAHSEKLIRLNESG